MTYSITVCDEFERVVQSVLIDGKASPLQNGNVYANTITQYLQQIQSGDTVYKIETEQGVLVGVFVLDTNTLERRLSLRRPFAVFVNDIQQQIDFYVNGGQYLFDSILGQVDGQVSYTFREYDPNDYLTQVYSFVWMDEVERVVQSVLIDSGDFGLVNGNVAKQKLDAIYNSLSGYHVAYRIENQQGVLVGFFAYNIEADEKILFRRRSYDSFSEDIETAVNDFIQSGGYRFDYLNEPAYQGRTSYDFRDYNPNDYLVQQYIPTKLEYEKRIVQAVLIDNKTQFLTLNANGNVVRAELDDFMERLSGYRITYKLENQQGVLVGFFAYDPCIEGNIIAVRSPYKKFAAAINDYVQSFILSGVWNFDILNLEPCKPEDLPCYLTINNCFATLNDCFAVIDPKKIFVKRYF